MNKFLLAAAITFVVSAGCFSQTVAPGVPVPKEGHEIFATITKWADAVRRRDTKALESIFEEGLIVSTFDGKTRGRAEELEILKPGGDLKTVSVNNEDVKVRFFENTAVVTALTRMKFLIGEKESQTAFRYTAVFVKKDGRWQLAALHTARPQQP